MATYTEITNTRIQNQLNKRYAAEISALTNLGFQHLASCLEDHGPYSALKNSLAALYALAKREVLRFSWPFHLTVANVLMTTEDPPTIALCMGLGVKFYTSFYDGTVMISSDFISHAIPRFDSKILRLPSQNNLADTWTEHKAKAMTMSGQMEFL